jgi:hypothetical protein
MSEIRFNRLKATSDFDFKTRVESPNYVFTNGQLVINGNLSIPSGTTAQRPSAPSAGQIRYNTETGYVESYDGTNWLSIILVQPGLYTPPAGEETVGQDLVQGGLVAYYDMADPRSYRGWGNYALNMAEDINKVDYAASQSPGSITFQGTYNIQRSYGIELQVAGAGHAYSASNISYNQITYEMWYRQMKDTNNNERILFNKENEIEIRLDSGNSQYGFVRWALRTPSTTWFWESTGFSVPRGKPVHIAMTYDGQNIRVYVNGSMIDFYTYSTPDSITTRTDSYHKFGARTAGQTAQGNPFRGSMFQWRIYNRALGSDEVRQNYNATCSKFGHVPVPADPDWVQDSSLILHYDTRFDASYTMDNTSVANMSSGNGNPSVGSLQSANTAAWFAPINNTANGCIRAMRRNSQVNDRINVDNFTLPGAERTVEAWIYPSNGSSLATSSSLYTIFDDGSNRVRFGLNGGLRIVLDPSMDTGVNLTAQQWSQVVYTMDGDNLVRVYVNGAEVYNGTYGGTRTTGTQTAHAFRCDNTNTGSRIYHTILRYYNRPLTAAEVLVNYNADKEEHGLS